MRSRSPPSSRARGEIRRPARRGARDCALGGGRVEAPSFAGKLKNKKPTPINISFFAAAGRARRPRKSVQRQRFGVRGSARAHHSDRSARRRGGRSRCRGIVLRRRVSDEPLAREGRGFGRLRRIGTLAFGPQLKRHACAALRAGSLSSLGLYWTFIYCRFWRAQ